MARNCITVQILGSQADGGDVSSWRDDDVSISLPTSALTTTSGATMDHAFTIDMRTGEIHIEGIACVIGAQTTRDDVLRGLTDLLEPDAKTNAAGITWHRLRGLTFGGETASLSMCFGPHGLQSISFGVGLPDPELEDGWPTKKETQREIAFVCRTLREMWKRSFNGTAAFAWGTVWATYDVFSHASSIGLRYTAAR